MRLCSFVAGALVAGISSTAWAHPGPRIWLSVTGGQVRTWAGPYPPTSTVSDYSLSRVFAQDMGTDLDDDGVSWQTQFPGFQKLPSAPLVSGTNFSYNIMGESQWYSAATASFEPISIAFPTSTPRFVITNAPGENVYTAAGFVTGSLAFTYGGSASDHGHLTYTLLGDGTNFDGPVGIYALPLQVTSPGALASETYWLLLGNGATAAELAQASAVANATLVPEPASLCWVAAGVTALMGRRRRR